MGPRPHSWVNVSFARIFPLFFFHLSNFAFLPSASAAGSIGGIARLLWGPSSLTGHAGHVSTLVPSASRMMGRTAIAVRLRVTFPI